jgi:hypothetical protein
MIYVKKQVLSSNPEHIPIASKVHILVVETARGVTEAW